MKKTILTLTLLCLLSAPAFAHEGHDTPNEETSSQTNELVLTDAMITNLGIKTFTVVPQDVSETVDLLGNIDYLPERQAIVSTQAEGSVTSILVRSGQEVKKGQNVAVIQPRLVGNPAITLTAPIDGHVTEQNVVIGQSVTPDQPLLRIADLSEVLVRGQAYEDALRSGLVVGNSVIVTTPSLPGAFFDGTVQRIDATLRPETRVREIWAVVENPDGKLLSNMQASLSIKAGEHKSALVVPQRAVLGDTGNYFIYVQKGDHFFRREVTLGQKVGPMREIIHGVSEGEQVVTVGNYQLQFVTPTKEDHDEDSHDHGHGHEH